MGEHVEYVQELEVAHELVRCEPEELQEPPLELAVRSALRCDSTTAQIMNFDGWLPNPGRGVRRGGEAAAVRLARRRGATSTQANCGPSDWPAQRVCSALTIGKLLLGNIKSPGHGPAANKHKRIHRRRARKYACFGFCRNAIDGGMRARTTEDGHRVGDGVTQERRTCVICHGIDAFCDSSSSQHLRYFS